MIFDPDPRVHAAYIAAADAVRDARDAFEDAIKKEPVAKARRELTACLRGLDVVQEGLRVAKMIRDKP
jgi:hypothetical protein